jgi:hypothetical protein
MRTGECPGCGGDPLGHRAPTRASPRGQHSQRRTDSGKMPPVPESVSRTSSALRPQLRRDEAVGAYAKGRFANGAPTTLPRWVVTFAARFETPRDPSAAFGGSSSNQSFPPLCADYCFN